MKNKTSSFTYKKIINFIIIILSIILLIILITNFLNDYIDIKEGLTTIEDLVDCKTNKPLICGTDDTNFKYYDIKSGTCEEAYGESSQDPCGVLLSYCVDEVTPNIKTPVNNKNSSTTAAACSLLSHKFSEIQTIRQNTCKQ